MENQKKSPVTIGATGGKIISVAGVFMGSKTKRIKLPISFVL